MRQFSASIPIGIGDLLYLKAMFEPIKDSFSSINLNTSMFLLEDYKKSPDNQQFVKSLVELLFSEAPYTINAEPAPYQSLSQISQNNNIVPQKPELAHILCQGTSLDLEEPYIVINTKVRYMLDSTLESTIREFWSLLNELSIKYKIVILGEREIEMNSEYKIHNSKGNYIFSLYPHILNNIKDHNRLLDLSVPALGVTSPDLQKMRQDCLIMKEAKFVIQFGVGGSFCLATAVANTIGYRIDDDYIADQVFGKNYSNAVITKDWNTFIRALKGHL
jgi:hypothetical protein